MFLVPKLDGRINHNENHKAKKDHPHVMRTRCKSHLSNLVRLSRLPKDQGGEHAQLVKQLPQHFSLQLLPIVALVHAHYNVHWEAENIASCHTPDNFLRGVNIKALGRKANIVSLNVPNVSKLNKLMPLQHSLWVQSDNRSMDSPIGIVKPWPSFVQRCRQRLCLRIQTFGAWL